MPENSPYTPLTVWKWDKEGGGRFANLNRPIADATHDRELPVGEHPPAALFARDAPNGVKVTVLPVESRVRLD